MALLVLSVRLSLCRSVGLYLEFFSLGPMLYAIPLSWFVGYTVKTQKEEIVSPVGLERQGPDTHRRLLIHIYTMMYIHNKAYNYLSGADIQASQSE